MQLAVVEFARHELGITDATSSEFDKSVVGTEAEVRLWQVASGLLGCGPFRRINRLLPINRFLPIRRSHVAANPLR